jgi:hypothetical protein
MFIGFHYWIFINGSELLTRKNEITIFELESEI